MNLYKIILVALLVALVSFESEGFWGRRRRRRRCIPAVKCTPVSCQVTNWQNWGPCSSARCGFQMRHRFVSLLPRCNGFCPSLSESRRCNLNCENGGTLLGGVCICRHSYSGTCCETYHPPPREYHPAPRLCHGRDGLDEVERKRRRSQDCEEPN